MTTILYTLRIVGPDQWGDDTADEIAEAAEPHDTTEFAQVTRWLGGFVNDAEGDLSAALPDGWYAVVEECREEVPS